MSARSESDGFSEIARLGDLSVYTCQQLLDTIQYMNVQIENLVDFQRITWENAQVLVSICYDPQGKFLRIEREVWKNHGLDLNHEQDH
jgi:hypothetical protein